MLALPLKSAKALKIAVSDIPLSFDAPLYIGTPASIRINLILPETRVPITYIFAADSMGRSSCFHGGLRKTQSMFCAIECVMAVQGHPRSLM